MPEGVEQRRDLLLLLSLLLVIIMYPVMDHDLAEKLIIALLTFVSLIFATIKLSQKKVGYGHQCSWFPALCCSRLRISSLPIQPSQRRHR